jgi:NTE family protein
MLWDRIARRAFGLGGGGDTMHIETVGRQEAPVDSARLGLALGVGAAHPTQISQITGEAGLLTLSQIKEVSK